MYYTWYYIEQTFLHQCKSKQIKQVACYDEISYCAFNNSGSITKRNIYPTLNSFSCSTLKGQQF